MNWPDWSLRRPAVADPLRAAAALWTVSTRIVRDVNTTVYAAAAAAELLPALSFTTGVVVVPPPLQFSVTWPW